MRSSVDVAVVGGGVIGLALAREVSSRGASVMVIERGRTGEEASSAAAGLLSPQSDAVGPSPFFDLARESRDLYPDWAAALVTTQVLSHLAGRTVESASATLELGPAAWSWQRRVWSVDPACGCCWSPRAEW